MKADIVIEGNDSIATYPRRSHMVVKEGQNNPYNAGPVFIVGMNGSGTTMLADSLGNHPDLYVFRRETLILPYFISRISSYGDLSELSARRKLADDLGKSFPFWKANNKQPVILNNKALEKPDFSGVVDSIMKHFALSQGKKRWGEKSPMYTQHIGLLGTYFPDARFIHIYRDGRDVAQSLHRRYKRDPRWTIWRWKNIVKMGRIQGQKLGAYRYMEINYETLTSDPESHLRQICDFLGLKYNSSLCRASMRQMDPNIKAAFIVPNSEKWRTYFSKKQLLELELIAGTFLSELGYTIAIVQESIDPSIWRLRWWRLYDHLRLTWRNFQKRGIRSTSNFLRKAISAIRQRRTNYY